MKIIYFIAFFLLIGLASTIQAQKTTVLLQGTQEITPLAYYELSREAEQFYQQQNYAKAAETYEKLTKAYSLDGEKWHRLGTSLYQLGKFREAIPAFLKAYELGVPSFPQYNALDIAKSYARAGDTENSLMWLGKTLHDLRFNQKPSLLSDPAFVSLRNNPRFLELVGDLPKRELSRDEGWRYDVNYLLSEIKRLNPVYSKAPLPEELVRAADQLKYEIPKLSNEQVFVEMLHLLTLLNQSHNSLFPSGDRVKLTQFPLYFYAFPEGLYIVDALAPYEDLIGARVLRFDDTTAERAIEATSYIVGRENDMAVLWTVPENLKIVQLLHALKLTKSPDRVNLTVLDIEGKTRTVNPEPVNLIPRRKLKAPPLANLPAPPLYLTRPDDQHWFEYLEKDKTLYLQFNQVANKQNGESLAQLGLRVRDFLAKNDISNIVVDVRRNNGGDTYFYTELLRTLIDFDANKDKRLFVLTGRWTFSAASNFIADIDRLTNAVFVGEPSSSTPLMIGGDESQIVLPYSGIRGALATTSWALTGPRDTRLWIPIDIPVQTTAKDYFANRDPVMDTIKALINKVGKQ
jgi:tetratricopeptide (TPR) repeat protein